MDNKNNRLFYWNVKDFMEKKPVAFENKRDSLKDTVSKILSENNVYRTSNYSENKNLTEQVQRQIERISIDENKYISKNTKEKTNSVANPFYLSEALATARQAIGSRAKMSSIATLASDDIKEIPTAEDMPSGGLNTPASVEDEEPAEPKPGMPAPLTSAPMTLGSPNGTTPAAPTPASAPSVGPAQLKAPTALPPGTPGTVQMGPPSPPPAQIPGKPDVGIKTDPGNAIASRLARARREASIARNKISYETDPARKQAQRDIADQKFAELREIEAEYDEWKMTASTADIKKAEAWKGPSYTPDAGAQRDYQSNLRRMQDEYAKRIKDSKNAPKMNADAAKKKAEEEARKTPAERAKRMKMAEALAKELGTTVQDLLKTSEFFRKEYGDLF